MTESEANYPVKCTNTTFALGKDCNWSGTVKDCTITRDTDFGRWFTFVNCPKCRSTCVEVNHNSPMNHPLYNL